jgi:hypothetical protein
MARQSGEAAQKYGLMKTARTVSAFKCEVEGDEEFESLPSIAPGCELDFQAESESVEAVRQATDVASLPQRD